MFSIVEQTYLLGLLKSEKTATRFTSGEWNKSRTAQFYRVMSLLKENDLIISIPDKNNRKAKQYRLTVFGQAMASLVAKHTKTEGYKKYAFVVEMLLL